jgi:hypothetical protein
MIRRICFCSAVLPLVFALACTANAQGTARPKAKSAPAKSNTNTPGTPKSAATTEPEKPKPNFSGEWSMNAEQSDFGKFPKPTTITRVITENGADLDIDTTQRGVNGEQTAHVHYRLDGEDTTNQLSSGVGTSHAFWDDQTLVIRTTMKTRSDVDVAMEERWTLSADNKTMVTTSHIETSKGGTDLKLVCDRVK